MNPRNMENVRPAIVEDDDDGEDMVVPDDDEDEGDSESESESDSNSNTETEDMTQEEEEDENGGKLLVQEVVRQLPENMELDLCPSGSNRMRYINHVANGVQAVVSNVHEESDDSIDINWMDDALIMNALEKNNTRQKGFSRLVRDAIKNPTGQVPLPPPPTPIVEVAENPPGPSMEAVKKVPGPSVQEAVKVPAPSVQVPKKEATPVAPRAFFTGNPTSSSVQTDKVTGGGIPNSCFLTPMENHFCPSDIPKPRLINPRSVCTLLQQDCMTLNMGPPLNQLRVLTPSWMQQERREN